MLEQDVKVIDKASFGGWVKFEKARENRRLAVESSVTGSMTRAMVL